LVEFEADIFFDAVCFGISEIDAVERVREVGQAWILMSVVVLRGLRRREPIIRRKRRSSFHTNERSVLGSMCKRGSWVFGRHLSHSLWRGARVFPFCWREETAGVLKSEYLLMCPRRWFNRKRQVTYKGIFDLYIISKADHLKFVEVYATVPCRELHVVMECSYTQDLLLYTAC
jgi:hypothetical protein